MATATQKPDPAALYLADYEQFEGKLSDGEGREWLSEMSRGAIQKFGELGFPTTRDESWRQTSIAPILRMAFKPADARDLTPTEEERLKGHVFVGFEGTRLVFINGHYWEKESVAGELPNGVIVKSLSQAVKEHAELVRRHLGKYIADDKDAFVALNTAFMQDGAFIYIPEGVEIAKPIQLRFVTSDSEEPEISHPRNLIIAERGSKATIIETYLGLGDKPYFTNGVTEVALSEGAVLDHYKLQREAKQAFHLGAIQIHQAGDSNFANHVISLGSEISRSDIHAVIDGENAVCTLNGLYIASDDQHMDTHTKLEHAKPHCKSHQLYKGILDDEATAVFNGWILVKQDAQRTDAIQSNRALLLSESATINTQPQLEIYADDVKCTHGATVGELAKDALFYLQSRGISREEARDMLTYAFANEIIDEIKIESVREHLEHLIWERFRHDRR